MNNGATLRLEGQGSASVVGGSPGPLVLTIAIAAADLRAPQLRNEDPTVAGQVLTQEPTVQAKPFPPTGPSESTLSQPLAASQAGSALVQMAISGLPRITVIRSGASPPAVSSASFPSLRLAAGQARSTPDRMAISGLPSTAATRSVASLPANKDDNGSVPGARAGTDPLLHVCVSTVRQALLFS